MGISVTTKTRDGLPVATPLGYETLAAVEFDTDYASSGGESLTKADLKIPDEATITHVSCQSAAGFVFDYDAADEAIIAYWVDTSVDGAPMAEVTAGANGLDGVVCHVRVTAVV